MEIIELRRGDFIYRGAAGRGMGVFRIDPKGHWRAGYLQIKMPSRADRTIIRMGEGAAFRSLLQAR